MIFGRPEVVDIKSLFLYFLHIMGKLRAIWRHEVRQANQISRVLIQDQKVKLNWRVLLLPLFLLDVIHYKYRLRVLRKNLLFTRQLAFEATRNITNGQERGWQIRRIEIKTRDTLDKDKKGHYTEKIRRKQLNEIEPLITHYLELINTGKSRYPEMIKAVYPAKGNYLNFISNLQKLEEEVIQAAITTTRKGTKKERRVWFEKVKTITKDARMTEADRLYAEQ
jgi:hypothetical protein